MSARTDPRPFAALTPDAVLDAAEAAGLEPDGHVFALNSYENRVYRLGRNDAPPVVVKFYRAGRWSDEQILEEHGFCFELAEHELSVVAPCRNVAGESLFHYQGFRFALYPRQGGHAPEFDNNDNLLILGRMLGRIHSIGAIRPFLHRPVLDSRSFGHDSVALIAERFIPDEYRPSYLAVTEQLLTAVDEIMAAVSPRYIRAHGDCHAGNILWRDGAPHFVDFDDARMAPAIQDLWMMLSGERARQLEQLAQLVKGYDEFYEFHPGELRLIEALRALRMLHYSAWLASRWEDPTFPITFPWFNTVRYWGEHVLQLREQLSALEEPPLELP
jgi:Ser/Thr protein kinase RdoA (MazF antagonist)